MNRPIFYIGTHMVNHAPNFDYCMVSVNRLRGRKSDFYPKHWIMDSGAFTELSTYGHYRHDVAEYASQVNRWKDCGMMDAAVSQDYMCEPFILEKTGLTVEEHQWLTIKRYRLLCEMTDAYIMPVLQGYQPEEYVRHIYMYGRLLGDCQWVGVGSVCKRNSRVSDIENVLMAIKAKNPALQLHGFGLKRTALTSDIVARCLWSCDSMAWSYQARRMGGNRNGLTEAQEYVQVVNTLKRQGALFI